MRRCGACEARSPMVSMLLLQGREQCLAECSQESFLESVQETMAYQRTGATWGAL